LAEADFGLHLAGPTGVFKTEEAALAQQHFGPGMDARHLPASWLSTGNALEGIAFVTKNALLVCDDFAPTGSTADVQRMHREADRILRAQGNLAGRQRMRPDATLRPTRPPRGLILSTGEDVPRGQSLRARFFVVELSRGEISPGKLTASQRDAAAGLYAACMAGFLKWLAARYPEVHEGFGREHAALREKVLSGGHGQHARTPSIIADLALGLEFFLAFALQAGAITVAERDALEKRCWAALGKAAQAQAEQIEASEPCGHFLRLLAGAIASGRAHVACPNGKEPPNPEAWGWRATECTDQRGGYRETETFWTPLGKRIGWLDEDGLFIQPDAAFAEAQELARHQGEVLPVTPRTLWRRLRERGLLAGWDSGRQRNTVRRTFEKVKDRDVLHLRVDALSPCEKPSESSERAGATGPSLEKTDSFCGRSGGQSDGPADGPSAKTVRKNGSKTNEKTVCGRFGQSDPDGKTGPEHDLFFQEGDYDCF
jgi:hypothetical protein